jgi:type I restriction enzyme S subunit
MKLTVNREMADPIFFYYAFSTLEQQDYIRQNAIQTGVPHTNLGFLRRTPVPLPPLHEQRAIARILGALDDKIELNREMNNTLEMMVLSLFKSWFVDFDPVRTKSEGRDPGLPKLLSDLFPESFDESELGKVPKGWAVKTIEAIARRVGMGPFGSSIKVESFAPNGIPVISGQHLRGFMVEDTTFNFVTKEHADRLNSANVQRGDVIFTHAGNIGQVAYIPENSRYERYVISQRQFFMRCDPTQATPTFVTFYFKSPEGQHRLLANASSSGVPSLARPVTYLRSIRLTVPPKAILDAFERLLQPMLTQFRRNLDESSTLAALRDTLLPKLISGDLRVKKAERILGERV